MQSQSMERRRELDAQPVAAFGVLILYHVGMFYVSWDWHVKSAHESRVLELFMLVTNPWRLSLLFFISGIAARFAFDRLGGWTFLRKRAVRLGVPIAVGMLLVVAPQSYFQLREAGLVEPGFGRFYPQYLTNAFWPDLITPTWNHLWFVVYLLIYSLPLALFGGSLARLADRHAATFSRVMRGWRLLLLPALPLVAYILVLRPLFPITHDVVNDWYNHALSFTVMLYGFLIAKNLAFWDALARLRRPALLLGLGCYAFLALGYGLYIWTDLDIPVPLWRTVHNLDTWVWIVAMGGYARSYWRHPPSWVIAANAVVFPWYILHQTITVSAGYRLSQLSLGPVVEPVLLIAATGLGCLIGGEIIRRTPVLRPLFGMPQRRSAHGRAARNKTVEISG